MVLNLERYSAVFVAGIFVLLLMMPSVCMASGREPDDAWRYLQPGIQMLWNVDTGEESVNNGRIWEIIEELKKFIQMYPGSNHEAEAYYLLGIAYSRVGYMPEAEAHWMITAKYYPESQWSGDALTMLADYLEKTGNRKKLENFYSGLVRDFPGSNAALAMETVLAIEALEDGRMELAKAAVKDIEKKGGEGVELNVPKFLDLKARIAEQQGDTETARRLWIHYLNLVKTPEIRADILYRIAETYRKAGDPLKAHKYYALIKRDFPFLKEAEFARFRMTEIEERAREKMMGYVSGLGQRNLALVDKLYTDIVEKYPDEAITVEVMTELIDIKLQEHKYLEALQLAERFSSVHSGSRFMPRVEKMAARAARRLVDNTGNSIVAERAVDWCRQFIARKDNNRVQQEAANAGIMLWKRFLSMLYDEKKYYKLMDSFSRFEKLAGVENGMVMDSMDVVRRALADLSEMLLEKGRFMELLNYYAIKKDMIHTLNAGGVHYNIGRAWKMAGAADAAMKAFYLEYRTSGDKKAGADALLELARTAVPDNRPEDARNALVIYDFIMENQAVPSDVALLKAKAAYEDGDWLAAFNIAKDTLADNSTAGAGAEVLFRAAVRMGMWDYARRAWNRYSGRFETGTDDLRLWGDTALELLEPGVAREAYLKLLEHEPDDMSTKWKLARAMELLGDKEGATEILKGLKGGNEEFWSRIAGADSSYQEFRNGVAGGL